MGTLTEIEPYGVLYNPEGFVPWTTPRGGPVEPAPYRFQLPWNDPFASDDYLQVPIGTGMASNYVPTSDPMHTHLVTMNPGLNYSDWTDPYYDVKSTDPVCSQILCVGYLAGASADGTSQPKRWQDVKNTETMTMVGMGPASKRYTAVNGSQFRLPTIAQWKSLNNTDRKVMLCFMYDITVQTDTYNDAGTSIISTTTEFFPAGTLKVEMQKFQRITGQNYIVCTTMSKQNMVTGSGMTEGAVANGAHVDGYARSWEMALALAGDKYAFKHGLKVGMSDAFLKSGPKWPARTQDGNGTTSYTGWFPYGTHLVLPMSYNIEVQQPSAPAYAKAFLYAWQLYGYWVMIRAGSGGVLGFGVEPRSPILTTVQANAIKDAIRAAIPSARVSAVSNYVAGSGPGTYNSVTRKMNVFQPWGGGTALTAGRGLVDLDDTTGFKLPINPDPASWV